MKKINYNVNEFSDKDNLLKNYEIPFPKNTLFYAIGIMFKPILNKSRFEIEEEGLKTHVGYFRSPILADNEKVFLYDFFKSDSHLEMDLLHILTFQELEELKNTVNKVDLCISNVSEVKKINYIIFLNKDNLKLRKYVKVIYKEKSELDNYILDMLNQNKLSYFMETEKEIDNMLDEMLSLSNGEKKYYPTCKAINPLNITLNDLFLEEYMSKERIEELENDIEFQKEIEELIESNKKYELEKDKKDIFDLNKQFTFNRLTGFKYI